MNRGIYGIISLICSVHSGLPDTISRKEFDSILTGPGGVGTSETCRKKWLMLTDAGWFVPVGDDLCRIDRDLIADTMERYRIDIIYDADGGCENRSLLKELMKRSVDVERSIYFDGRPSDGYPAGVRAIESRHT